VILIAAVPVPSSRSQSISKHSINSLRAAMKTTTAALLGLAVAVAVASSQVQARAVVHSKRQNLTDVPVNENVLRRNW
jgi:hypothetical protein